MDLKQLSYFVTLADELHFGRASFRLNISQPALSLQIRALENNLGGALFRRTSRNVELTEAGQTLYAAARDILEKTEVAETRVRQVLKGEVGTLRLAYSGGAFFSGVLRRVIQTVRQYMPGIEFELHDATPSRQMEGLMSRKFHAGLMTTRTFTLTEDLTATTLASWPIRVALPRNHALARLDDIPAEALLDECFYTYAEAQRDNEIWIETILGTVPKTSHSVSSIEMVITLVGAGLGIALLPASVLWQNPDDAVVYKPLRDRNMSMDSSLVRHRSEEEPGVAQALDVIETKFS